MPIYDLIAGPLRSFRAASLSQIELKPGQKVLIVGAGTGLDLEFLKDQEVTAGDITPGMVALLKRRAEKLQMDVEASVMDGQNLHLPNGEYDIVILHLILAVIPDPYLCIKEAERVLKPGGQVSIMDKFMQEKKPGIMRRALNVVTNSLFSAIDRNVDDIVSRTDLVKMSDEKIRWVFRRVKLVKKPN